VTGSVVARGVTGDGDSIRVAAQLGGVLGDPTQCGPAVVDAGRERGVGDFCYTFSGER
jgi:hypothetical protein